MRSNPSTGIPLIVLFLLLGLVACGADDEPAGETDGTGARAVLGDLDEAAVDAGGELAATIPSAVRSRLESMKKAATTASDAPVLTVDYPLPGSMFPPEFVAPAFLWHDPDPEADVWLVEIAFADDAARPITVLVPKAPPPAGEIDREAMSDTNALYEGSEYQQSAISWTPSDPVWMRIKERSSETPATITFTGFASGDLGTPLSRGATRIVTSKDPVDGMLFYRDVPLMATVGEKGRIKPLGIKGIPLIAWRMKDVSRRDSKVVLTGMPSCGNCHSFSLDGKTLGMDVDGPDGDKGMYAIKPVSEHMTISNDDVITWNSFEGKPEGHKTIGFGSRVSPDGEFVVTTVNEALFVMNFMDYRFQQVFYPTRGILAYHPREEGGIRAIPGADDPEYVHCNPVWSPDGKTLVFSRAKAFDPYEGVTELPQVPNDPREPQIRYDLYRMPFNDGKGGVPVPVEGASNNGMSNTFPKVSPDGKWIVFTKCKNGLLMRPDGRLWIVPIEGGEARKMNCNTSLMNSWHSFSPNGRWMVFSSKSRTPYTQAFLTHIDEDGNDTPAILVPSCTAANRAVNLPEFVNAPYDGIERIEVPAVKHHVHTQAGQRLVEEKAWPRAIAALEKAIEVEPTFVRAHVLLSYALMQVGRYETAVLHAVRAAEIEPRNPTALFNAEVCFLNLGRPHMAIRYLKRLIDVAPGYPQASQDMALARREARGLEYEIAKLEREVAARPRDAGLQQRLSDLYVKAGRLEDGLKHLETSIEISPRNLMAVVNLAWLLATNPDDAIRDGKRAVEVAEKAVALTGSGDPAILAVYAAALSEAGRQKEAVAAAEKALGLAKRVSLELAAEIDKRLRQQRRGEPIRGIPAR